MSLSIPFSLISISIVLDWIIQTKVLLFELLETENVGKQYKIKIMFVQEICK